MDLPHRCQGNSFVITHDVGVRIEGLRSLGLKTPDASDSIFEEFYSELGAWIKKMLPETEVVTFDMTGLASDIWCRALKLKTELASAVVVSTCAELAATRRGQVIEMNRIVDTSGHIIGFGPRPGTPTLGAQFNGIAELSRGKSVVIAEDGAFSGSTIEYVVKNLAERNVEVAAVVVGICFPHALEHFSTQFNGKLAVIEQLEKPYEWMPDHDFLPFVPNCGRVVGAMFGNEGMPYYTHDGVSFSIPYILPFGDPVKWASIPQEHAVAFSSFCLDRARRLYHRLDEMNGRRLTIRDLSGSTPRVSMPMTKGEGRLPNLDYSISGFLDEVCHEF